jgi:hypothetical protein
MKNEKRTFIGHVDTLVVDCVINKRDYCRFSKIKLIVHFYGNKYSDTLIFQNTFDPCNFDAISSFYTNSTIEKRYFLSVNAFEEKTLVFPKKDTSFTFRMQKRLHGSLSNILSENDEIIFSHYDLIYKHENSNLYVAKDNLTAIVLMVDDTIVKDKESHLFNLPPVIPDSTTMYISD